MQLTFQLVDGEQILGLTPQYCWHQTIRANKVKTGALPTEARHAKTPAGKATINLVAYWHPRSKLLCCVNEETTEIAPSSSLTGLAAPVDRDYLPKKNTHTNSIEPYVHCTLLDCLISFGNVFTRQSYADRHDQSKDGFDQWGGPKFRGLGVCGNSLPLLSDNLILWLSVCKLVYAVNNDERTGH
jgi:hypothetical protein